MTIPTWAYVGAGAIVYWWFRTNAINTAKNTQVASASPVTGNFQFGDLGLGQVFSSQSDV